nr:MAG TPA: hypothetical protein [Caudoviricetes sp.]
MGLSRERKSFVKKFMSITLLYRIMFSKHKDF